jgi:hypothetical protein
MATIITNYLRPPKAPNLAVATIEYEQRYQDQLNNQLRIYFNELDNSLRGLLGSDGAGGKFIRFPYGAFQDQTDQTIPSNTAQVMRFDTTDYVNGVSLGSHTAVFTGTIDDGTPPGAGTVLTVSAVTSGTIYLGMTLTGGAITAGTKVVSQTSGTAGGVGAYVVSVSQERTSLTITGTIQSSITVENPGIYNLQWSGQFQNTDNQIQDISVWLRKGSTGNGTDIVGSSGLISIPARKSASAGEEAHEIVGWNYFLELQANEFVELWWSSTLDSVTLQYYAAATSPTRPSTASVIATLSFVSALPA